MSEAPKLKFEKMDKSKAQNIVSNFKLGFMVYIFPYSEFASLLAFKQSVVKIFTVNFVSLNNICNDEIRRQEYKI